jgi:hypothetical protein
MLMHDIGSSFLNDGEWRISVQAAGLGKSEKRSLEWMARCISGKGPNKGSARGKIPRAIKNLPHYSKFTAPKNLLADGSRQRRWMYIEAPGRFKSTVPKDPDAH